MYSGKQTVNLAKGDTLSVAAHTSGSDLSYQWYKDGKLIPDATNAIYEILAESAQDCGIYAVQVTSASGVRTRLFDVCRVAAVLEQPLAGDLNLDGAVTVADVVLLQKHLIRAATLTDQQAAAGDLNKDGVCNGFDLVLLRRILCV